MSANQSTSTELSDGSRRKANLPWVEKYRPNALEELISHDDIVRTIRKFISQVNTVKSRVEARVTIQKIKSLGVLQFEFYVVKGGATNRDMSLTKTC